MNKDEQWAAVAFGQMDRPRCRSRLSPMQMRLAHQQAHGEKNTHVPDIDRSDYKVEDSEDL